MTYVFDNSPLSVLFKNYYPGVFRSLWDGFDSLVIAGKIMSTREVRREIDDSGITPLIDWAELHKDLFATPTGGGRSIRSENLFCFSFSTEYRN